MSRRPGTFGASRALMGALALILIVVGIWAAFTSTRGVPGVPRYNLTIQVPTAGKLTAGSDVMIAGNRIGLVKNVEATVAEDGTPVAEMELALSPEFEPLPADSTFSVHLLGALGRKVIDVRPGSASEDLEDGAFVSIAENPDSAQVNDIDEVLNSFTPGARAGTRSFFEAIGVGLAGRGADVNAFLEHAPDALYESASAQRILTDPDNDLPRFLSGLTGMSAELAPVAPVLPGLSSDLNTTFSALDSVSPDLQRAIERSPGAFERLTEVLPREARLFRASADLMDALEPGTSLLPKTAPILADALEAAAKNLHLVPRLSERLESGVDYLATYAEAPPVVPGSYRLADTANALLPPVRFIGPAETVCNYLSLLARNLASTTSEDSYLTGTAIRASGVVTDATRNSERGPSSSIWQSPPDITVGPLHSNPYPNTASPGQTRECEAGNEPYIQNRPIIGNVPGQQKATTEDPATQP